MKRLILGGLAALVLGGAVFAANLIWFRPFSIDHFFERQFIKSALIEPEQMSVLGILDGTPFDYYNDELTDASFAQYDRRLDLDKRSLETLRGYDRESLTPDQKLGYDIYEWFLENRISGEAYRMQAADSGPCSPYVIAQNSGAYLGLVDFMARVHRVETIGGAEDYIARLKAVAVKLDQQLFVAKEQVENGIVPPRFIIDKTLTNLHNIRDVDVQNSRYYAAFAEKIDRLDGLSREMAQAFKDQAAEIVRDVVNPAYDRTIAYFEGLGGEATNDAGVWKLPDGDAFYRYCVKSRTTTDLSPEDIHQLGLSEVARVAAEVKAIAKELGYGEVEIGAFFHEIESDPKFLRPETDKAKEEIVGEYQAILDEIASGIGATFNKQPKAPLEVRRIPKYQEATAASHYSSPSLDGSRPGVFFANLTTVPPSWSMRTLAYHEGIPGHHFQIGLQNELEGLPTLRKVLWFTAFVEGWALYAERLAWEMGYEEDPYDNLGRLRWELFRAARLVVDTGLHYKRWSREQAIDYMQAHFGRGEVSEVERYVVWPGQALAYKVGMLKILELRERAKTALGEAFDIREFHDVVIGNGAMPLEVLTRQVDAYIARKLSN